MKALIYRYGSICEPDIIDAFTRIGLQVIEIQTEITQKSLSDADRLQLVEQVLQTEHPLFVFSINFYPVIAEVCHIYKTLYLCWTVDSPVPELFSRSILHATNRIFLFDGAQFRDFSPYNPGCIHYLPLASATERFDKAIHSITASDRENYCSDIAFVGSLYSEKNPLRNLSSLQDHTKGYIAGLTEAALKIYGYNPVMDALSDEVVADIKRNAAGFFSLSNPVSDPDRYIAALFVA